VSHRRGVVLLVPQEVSTNGERPRAPGRKPGGNSPKGKGRLSSLKERRTASRARALLDEHGKLQDASVTPKKGFAARTRGRLAARLERGVPEKKFGTEDLYRGLWGPLLRVLYAHEGEKRARASSQPAFFSIWGK